MEQINLFQDKDVFELTGYLCVCVHVCVNLKEKLYNQILTLRPSCCCFVWKGVMYQNALWQNFKKILGSHSDAEM